MTVLLAHPLLAAADTKARERVVRELRASGIPLVLVNEAGMAEILLEYGVSIERRTSGRVFVMRDGRPVLIESFADDEKSFLERDPATNVARAFLPLYRQANDLSEER